MNALTIKNFYQDIFGNSCPDIDRFLRDNINKDIGHFNVFDISTICKGANGRAEMPYSKRTYYKISLIKGRNKVEYADKTIEITDCAVLFASPKIPYNYIHQEEKQSGHFCVFTPDFLPSLKTGQETEQFSVFSPQSDFVYQITAAQFKEINTIFIKMHEEIASDYAYKYDLLRNYLMELIHFGQKLQPIKALEQHKTAASRSTSLFIDLLERQFPIENLSQRVPLKTPADYAGQLGMHVNHLNRILKDTTGKTTGEIIGSRIYQEARILLKQTQWNISEIAYTLGFDEVAHFSNFFKKHGAQSPQHFREVAIV